MKLNQKPDGETKKAINDASQPGASSWLSAILLEQYGFALNKAEFRNAILLRYGKWLASYMSSWPEVQYCTCVKL